MANRVVNGTNYAWPMLPALASPPKGFVTKILHKTKNSASGIRQHPQVVGSGNAQTLRQLIILMTCATPGSKTAGQRAQGAYLVQQFAVNTKELRQRVRLFLESARIQLELLKQPPAQR